MSRDARRFFALVTADGSSLLSGVKEDCGPAVRPPHGAVIAPVTGRVPADVFQEPTRRVTFPPPAPGGAMSTFTVGYFVGSLARASINRKLAVALTRLAPEELRMQEIPIGELPL